MMTFPKYEKHKIQVPNHQPVMGLINVGYNMFGLNGDISAVKGEFWGYYIWGYHKMWT